MTGDMPKVMGYTANVGGYTINVVGRHAQCGGAT